MITEHPYLDNNGPTYTYGVCDHSACGTRTHGHRCPGRLCGESLYAHATMIVADTPDGRRRVLAVPR